MSRGKPEQVFYKVGSGPLRKSQNEESDYNNTMRSNDSQDQTNNQQRRQRKPEQPIYVPRPVANSREFPPSQQDNDNRSSNGNFDPRGKRYSNQRRRGESSDYGGETDRNNVNNRQFRQGSEPRNVGPGQQRYNNVRDTRSVEPVQGGGPPRGGHNSGYGGERGHPKPPTGRRHSTIGLENDKRRQHKMPNVENLPPRLQKKMMEEGKFRHYQNDDNWNGASLTFQGDNYNNARHQNYNSHNDSGGYSTIPRHRGRGRFVQDYNNSGPSYRSRTPDLQGYNSPCNSRPPTPPAYARTRSNDNLNHRPDSRPQSPAPVVNYHHHQQQPQQQLHQHQQQQPSHDYNRRNPRDRDRHRGGGSYYNNTNNINVNSSQRSDDRWNQNFEVTRKEDWSQLVKEEENVVENDSARQPVGPVVNEEVVPTVAEEEKSKSTSITVNNTVLDWSEEVELNDPLELGVLSDSRSRASSIASLVDISTKSTPSTAPTGNSSSAFKKSKRGKGGRERRRKSNASRDHSLDKTQGGRQQQQPIDGEGFRVPQDPASGSRRRRRRSREHRDKSFERRPASRNASRETSFDRASNRRRSSTCEPENWREEIIRSRKSSERDAAGMSGGSRRNSEREASNPPMNIVKKAGVLVLPSPPQKEAYTMDQPRYPTSELRKPASCQKSLFDPHNPNKPIIVKSPGSRVSVPGFSSDNPEAPPPQMYTDQFGNLRPTWYDDTSEGFKSCHYPDLLRDIIRADNELQCIIKFGQILLNWGQVELLRHFLKEALRYLLCKDLKFCQTENVEQHLWKILYHNIIEVTRKSIGQDPTNKDKYKEFLISLIDEGTGYLEGLLDLLEENYKFRLNDYLGPNSHNQHKGLRYVGLALISAQKLFLFLGDLGRYREQVNETSNYGRCRQWYIKAHELNPKNGKPYNQLAVLAVYARRKLDAVYFYMRSLMSSNPVPSAKEYLMSLFDDNRKKYEQGERKRREERIERAKQIMKQKESEDPERGPGALRHETWIRPDGGRRLRRTTQAVQELKDSEEEALATLSSVEVNKRFVISYLHVHGKLITKIGMESFQDAALQMLKEFRALLQHSPMPIPCNRFLQLLALNMFAIESTQLKDPQLQLQAGYRSELQERALVVSLQMFNLILERCITLLDEGRETNPLALHQDVHVLLPPIKIWCDWMLCHSSVWNPPPSTQDFKVGSPGDTWSRLAILMNLLEKLDKSVASALCSEPREGYEQVNLLEDTVLNGFTPLMVTDPDISYAPSDVDMELAQFTLRTNKLLFFGTVFLCGLEPTVLKLEIEDDFREYVSAVSTSNSRNSPVSLTRHNTDEVLMESFSEDEDEDEDVVSGDGVGLGEASSEVQELLTRKVELERTHRKQELHKQRVKKILSQAVVSVHIEVRPKYLVPDTNGFIDHLDIISLITASHVYTLMVPIVVLSELEGLSRGGRSPVPSTRSSLDPLHVLKVAESAKQALGFLKSKPQSVKCITTKGAVISSTTFTTEDDSGMDASFKNDDKILATCLALSKGYNKENQTAEEGEPKKLISEVVLLTDDRNLRVKAISRDVPVRELVDFKRWARLG